MNDELGSRLPLPHRRHAATQARSRPNAPVPGSLAGLTRRAALLGALSAAWPRLAGASTSRPHVPILVFHRFAATAVDAMTVRVANFAAQMRTLERLECAVIPLADWVAWRRGALAVLPPRAVVLTADDGHRSQVEVMLPMLRARGWPVTLFVYPSAVSNASYAVTWAQLRELASEPGVAVESHTLWHPNLLRERLRMSPDAFRRFAAMQLRRSRELLQEHLANPVTLLAWPFGLSDPGLGEQAAELGYDAAFSLGNRAATAEDSLFDVPRHLVVDSVDDRQLAGRLVAAFDAGSAP